MAHQPPLPPPEFWAEARKFRNVQTTDAAEYYHNGLQQEFCKTYPNIFMVIICIKIKHILHVKYLLKMREIEMGRTIKKVEWTNTKKLFILNQYEQ